MENGERNNSTAVEPDERERLLGDLRREHDMYLRALADFENYRRRVEREGARSAAGAKRDVLLPLLEVLDGFDRALPYLADAPASVADGIQAIHRRLLDLLNTQKVSRLQTVGVPFDPALHEAIGTVPATDRVPGTIADEAQAGYRLGDELLRPARVRVAR